MKLLNVKKETLKNFGAVSEECAREMVNGLMERTNCDVCLATTGIAGPGGATQNKNVGLMYVAVKNKYSTKVKKVELNPNYKRKTMKFYFSQVALDFLLEFLNDLNETKINCSQIQFCKEDLASEEEEEIIETEQDEDNYEQNAEDDSND